MLLIEQYTTDIHKLCEKYKVKKLYVFGSILTNRFMQESDVDLIVDFQPLDIREYADNYFDLKFALEETLHRSIDLLEEKSIRNPYFREAIENQRQLIYGY
jgi:predicted nucleotidyltransferase